MKLTWPIVFVTLAVAVYLVAGASPQPDDTGFDASGDGSDPADGAGSDPNMPAFDTLPASPVVRDLSTAISKAEGYGLSGAIPTRARNPGDLVIPGWKGAKLGSEGISVFQTDAEGWAHLWHQVQLIATGGSHVYSPMMTIAEMARKWTATQPNDWAGNVAAWLADHGYPGVTTDTVIADLFNV